LWALYAIPLGLGLIQFKALDRRDDTLPSEYASLVLDSLPQNALLLVKGDADAGILAYAHFLEKKRPDITLISQVAALLPQKPFDRATDIASKKHQVALLNLISAYLDTKRPVFSMGPVEYFSSESSPFPLKVKNYGLFQEIYEWDPPPARDFSALLPKALALLDKALHPSFDPNFKHYRNRIASDVCHGLLISETEHEAFSSLPACKRLKAQWLHVEKKDYLVADKLFMEAIKDSPLAQDSELAEMGKDFVLNRVKLMETMSTLSPSDQMKMTAEIFQVALPLALQFRTCKNRLAPKLLQLAQKNGFSEEATALQKAFPDCSW